METIATEIMRQPNLITDTEYYRVTSTLEYIPEELFSLDHDIELMNQNSTNNSGIAKNHALLLKVQAATVDAPCFTIQLVSNLSLFNEEIHVPKMTVLPELTHREPLLLKTIHFTLEITREDEACLVNIPISWYNRPQRDGTGNYWCWGPHCFFDEGEGQPLAAYKDAKLHYWGSQARIRPVVYYDVIRRFRQPIVVTKKRRKKMAVVREPETVPKKTVGMQTET